MEPHSLCLALLLIVHASAQTNVSTNATWALLAWGWENGGQDSTQGMQVVDIDLFDQSDLIPGLKANGQTVICYFSAGSWESDRPDSGNPLWSQVKIGPMNGWDELWLDIRKLTVLQTLMGARMDLAVSQGCDGVEPDNTDCYNNQDCWSTMQNPSVSSGQNVVPAQLAYNQWLAKYAHARGLLIALKNTIDLIPQLVDSFDFAINEECQTYSECGSYQPFIDQNKGILQVQYEDSDGICDQASTYQTQTKDCSGDGNICTSGSWTNCF